MGTLLQELGHDIVLLYFIDKVLKNRKHELFYILSPAIGPKIDVHFWNFEIGEYTSAYNMSSKNFIPEFNLKLNLGRDFIERLNEESNYQNQEWYQKLSQKVNRDLKEFIMELCHPIEENTNDLPDVIGINETGKETIWAELKFEGLGRKAIDSVLKQFKLAQKRGVPFYLVIPKQPLYGREITDSWIQKNLPSDMIVYKFALKNPVVIPKNEEIQFIEVGR